MANKPEAGIQRDKTQKEETSRTSIVGAHTGETPATANQNEAKTPGNPTQYGRYVLWPFVAIWGLIKWCLKTFEGHHGVVAALATVAIVYLT